MACDEHKSRKKGDCEECGGCKLCPPHTNCSGVQHVQVGKGKGGGKRRSTRKNEATQNGIAQKKARRSSRDSKIRGRDLLSMEDAPNTPDRASATIAPRSHPSVSVLARAITDGVAQSVMVAEKDGAGADNIATSLEKIISASLESSGICLMSTADTMATAAVQSLPPPSHQSRLSNRDKIQVVLNLIGEKKEDAMKNMPDGGFDFDGVDDERIPSSRTFARAKGIFFTIVHSVAALICPDHFDELGASFSIDTALSRDSNLRKNTVRLALIGEKTMSIAAGSLLAASYEHNTLRTMYEEAEVDVPESRKTIGERKFASLRRTHDIIQDGMSPPKHDYTYRVSVRVLQLAMEFMMDTLQLRPGATRTVKVDGFVFANVPV